MEGKKEKEEFVEFLARNNVITDSDVEMPAGGQEQILAHWCPVV